MAAAVRSAPARPLLTWYDDATGDRVELSAATLANWVAKTANLLRDQLDVAPGDDVDVLLPTHWLTAVALLGAWSVGADAHLAGTGAGVVLATPAQALEIEGATVLSVELAALLPLGAAAPEGAVDFRREVLACDDVFVPVGTLDPAAPALDDATAGDLVGSARDAVASWALTSDDRVLSTLPFVAGAHVPSTGLLAGLLAPLAAGASVVLCGSADGAQLPRRIVDERITATAGVGDPPPPARALVG